MANPSRTVYESPLFYVKEVPIDGREAPYTFVHRIGAVTVLPIIDSPAGQSHVLTINNNRRHYGLSAASLPGGNIDGGHITPEDPGAAALRELAEETGHGYKDGTPPNMDVFALRAVSNTIFYPRFFAVVRNVEPICPPDDDPAEVIDCCPTPLETYTDELLQLRNGRTYPEVNAAFAKAGMEVGREAVLGWLAGDMEVAGASDVPESFEPWLIRA